MSKNLAFYDPSSKKLHDVTDITVYALRVGGPNDCSNFIKQMFLSTFNAMKASNKFVVVRDKNVKKWIS